MGGVIRPSEAGEARKAEKLGKVGERAKRRRRARTALLAVALGFATFAAFARTEETSRPWKGRSGKVVVTGTLDVKRTLKETPDAASKPTDVYFRGENGKAYRFEYAKLCDADKARVDAALGSTAGSRSTGGANRRLDATPKDGALESPSGRKAFLVGADDYADALDLACVKNDVEALAARLIEIGFEAENVTVLKTGGSFEDFPTKANVETRFAAFLETLAPGDFVVVYLSGHGIQPTGSKESFFAPIDVKSSDPFGTAVSIDKMTAALGESDARFRWLIVDACRDDPTNAKAIFKTKSAAGAKGLVDPVKAPDSVCLLQSCAPGKFSYEGGAGLENGVFTLSLLEALDRNDPKADANADGFLMFTEILSYVTKRTNELAFEHHGASQIPRWSGAETTDFAALDDLLIDGIARAKWSEADALYREACALRSQKKWREALAQIQKAREINKVRKEYETAEAEIQAQVDATDANEKRAEADKLAADAWTTFDLGGEANVEKAIRLMKESLALVDLAANRRVLKTFETELKALRNPTSETPSRATVDDSSSSTSGYALAPRWNGKEYVPVDGSESKPSSPSTSNGSALASTHRYAQNSSSSSGRTSSTASGGWTGEYAAGTQKSLAIKGASYNFRYCPPGTFEMGSPGDEIEYRYNRETLHKIKLTSGFWMLETEVTQALWTSIMETNPSAFSLCGARADDVDVKETKDFPVESVSWEDCQIFIKRLNSENLLPNGLEFRLPTEAEWEYACRAGSKTAYSFGNNSASLADYGNISDISAGRKFNWSGRYEADDKHAIVAPVKSFKPNAWGLFDMHGNVEEWCQDKYDSWGYIDGVTSDPINNLAKIQARVVRGGYWGHNDTAARSAARDGALPTRGSYNTGLRLAIGRVLTPALKNDKAERRTLTAGTKKEFEVDGIKYVARYCPPGTFTMGSPEDEQGRKETEVQRRVEITKGFWMLETEVTVEMYRSFIEETGYRMGLGFNGFGGYGYDASGEQIQSHAITWKNPGFPQTDKHPVTGVDWEGACAFCWWLAWKLELPVRLPTEEEWEYACRAGTETPFYFGKEINDIIKYENVADSNMRRVLGRVKETVQGDDGYVFTAPVKTFAPNPWGLYDMLANVNEWCVNPWKTCGGSYRSYVSICRSAHKSEARNNIREATTGFRLVISEE